MKTLSLRLNQIVRGTDASEIAEAALVLPLMFMMLLGVFWFGQAFSIYGTITHAARVGARAAVTPPCSTCAAASDPSQNAYNAVQSALQAAHLDPNKLQKPTTPPGLCACGSPITSCTGGAAVPCDSGQGKICVQGITRSKKGVLDQDNVQLSSASVSSGGAGVCGVSVSFQYPFRFWLPGTSLNKQQLLLRAQAQMRVETQ